MSKITNSRIAHSLHNPITASENAGTLIILRILKETGKFPESLHISINKIIGNFSEFLLTQNHPLSDIIRTQSCNSVIDQLDEQLNDQDFLKSIQSLQNSIQNHVIPFVLKWFQSTNEIRGVVFTPSNIINFMWKTISRLLSSSQINNSLLFIDPVAGLLNFELSILQSYFENQDQDNNEIIGFFSNWICIELDPVFAFTQLVIRQILLLLCQNSKYGGNINNNNFLQTIFQNTLTQETFAQLSSIQRKDQSIPIILGNPPYSVSSNTRDPWIVNLMKKYQVPEPNITRLYDDYVKFFRFSESFFNQVSKQGILAFVSNRKFLDGKIYYGMRQSLLKSFNRALITDLFGDQRNRKNKLQAKTKNIFDIQTGVCISVWIKLTDESLDHQYQYIPILDIDKLPQIYNHLPSTYQNNKPFFYSLLNPSAPQYLLVPLHTPKNIQQIWEGSCLPLPQCFQQTSRAMISSRDKFMINFQKKALLQNIDLLAARDYSRLQKLKIIKTKDKILGDIDNPSTFDCALMKKSIIPISYRPFDFRFAIYYTINKRCGKSVILDHLNSFSKKIPFINNQLSGFQETELFNLGLNFVHSPQHPPFSHIFITQGVVDSGMFGYSTSKVAPIWIDDQLNFSPLCLKECLSFSKTSLDPLYYIYGLLHCPKYISTFEELLMHGYPRVFFTKSKPLFSKISLFGERLIKLHLGFTPANLESDYPNLKLIQKLEGAKLKEYDYDGQAEIINIVFNNDGNNTPKISKDHNISLKCSNAMWKFTIGSISVISYWLKNHRFSKFKSSLSTQDLSLLKKVLYIIKTSISIQQELDLLMKEGEFCEFIL